MVPKTKPMRRRWRSCGRLGLGLRRRRRCAHDGGRDLRRIGDRGLVVHRDRSFESRPRSSPLVDRGLRRRRGGRGKLELDRGEPLLHLDQIRIRRVFGQVDRELDGVGICQPNGVQRTRIGHGERQSVPRWNRRNRRLVDQLRCCQPWNSRMQALEDLRGDLGGLGERQIGDAPIAGLPLRRGWPLAAVCCTAPTTSTRTTSSDASSTGSRQLRRGQSPRSRSTGSSGGGAFPQRASRGFPCAGWLVARRRPVARLSLARLGGQLFEMEAHLFVILRRVVIGPRNASLSLIEVAVDGLGHVEAG